MSKKNEWLDCGLDLLVDSGAEALTIGALCQRLGKTKGSFYHHFGNRDGFLDSLLAHWEKGHTQDLIDSTPPEDSQNSLKELGRLANALPQNRELAFRTWSLRSQKVAKAVKNVDVMRVEHLKSLYVSMGKPQAEAEALAWLEYCVFLGMNQLGDTFPPSQIALSRELFQRRLIND